MMIDNAHGLDEIFPVIRSETLYCEKHGVNYVAKTIRIGGRHQTNGCPHCEAEKAQREAFERAKRFEEERKAQLLAATLSKIPVPPRFKDSSFANYELDQAGDRQGKRLAQLQDYADQFWEHHTRGTSMILSGGPGTGKTHLALSVAKQIAQIGFQAKYLTTRKLLRQVRATWGNRSQMTEQQVMDHLAEVDLLIIDEIGVQRGSDDELNTIFEIIDERYQNRRPTILITNLPWLELKQVIGDRSADRLRDCGGKLLTFDWDSHRAPTG